MAGLHLAALRRVAIPHRVVGVHDVSAAAAEAFAGRSGGRACATLNELFDTTHPDVVHVCTTAGTHFAPARAALAAGAHLYIEKPFVETKEEAEALFKIARASGLVICAGHQLLRDGAFTRVMDRAGDLGDPVLVQSYFAFRPPRDDPARASGHTLARQLVDILPHPLYTLVAALERVAPGAPPELIHASATPTDLQAIVGAGAVRGQLTVSLRARPVASTLTVTGTEGSLTADFVRAISVGAANPGTSPVEKLLNPFVEARQIAWRSAVSLARRLLGGGDYPGVVELFTDFYAAAAGRGPAPLTEDHLRRVVVLHEELAGRVRRSVAPAGARARPPGPLAVVTGAGGFFGKSIARALAGRGFRVRGIGRSEPPDDPHVHEWVRADLGRPLPAEALRGASVVVHAAAETAGGFDAHQRNTVDATRHVLAAMAAARVQRLVHVSSISVLRPPASLREIQDEATPLAPRAERLGPYTWGKCESEMLVTAAAREKTVDARILRPGALVDWTRPETPGLVGKRLFGRWHLGLGRPGLPFAVCAVADAGEAVAWCAARFERAPAIVNLMDPVVTTRRQLLRAMRDHGWRGRVVWVPIGLLAATAKTLMRVIALLRRDRGRPPDVWSVLRPRRYDPAVSARVFAALAEDRTPAPVPAARPRSAAYA